jgi:hypothetical protein
MNLYEKLDELGLDDDIKHKIMSAKHEEDREDRQFRRLDDLEEKIGKLQAEVAALTKSALGGGKGKEKDKDKDDDVDGIIDAVVKERCW